MLFSSMTFIFIFLPVVLLLYFCLPAKFRNSTLLWASIFFYAWGEPRYLLILFITVFCSYLGALLIDANRKNAVLWLCSAVCADLGILIYFKYTGFIVENLNQLFHSNIDFLHVLMPIGISFYTFQALSYLVDVYRKECEVQKNFYDLTLYIVLFPQLVAGPIVKYHDVAAQIRERSVTVDDFHYGLRRFIAGLSKKILIANTVGAVAERIFAQNPDSFGPGIAWIGAVFYTLQLYFDFSGYSDMAIGLCRLFGFRIQENFVYPYISRSITEFWRRWHISLSTWFKEYLYIPLGGNRCGNVRMYFNLFIVFLTTGIWHGASWNFVIWGLWHGFFIILEKLTSFHKTPGGRIKQIFAHIYTILVFVTGWVFFRSESSLYALRFIKKMFTFSGKEYVFNHATLFLSNMEILMFAAGLLCSMPLFKGLFALPENNSIAGRIKLLASDAYFLCLFILSVMFIAKSSFNPFIYFRF